MINGVATAAMMKADPHMASAKILRCWSHENNRRQPTSAEVNTMTATNVGKSNTMITTDAEIQRESSGKVCRLRTLRTRCYRGLKLPPVFEPNAMRKEEGRRSRPSLSSATGLRVLILVRGRKWRPALACQKLIPWPRRGKIAASITRRASTAFVCRASPSSMCEPLDT